MVNLITNPTTLNYIVLSILAVLIIALIYMTMYRQPTQSENFSNFNDYTIPYGYLNDSIKNPVSYDGLTTDGLINLKRLKPEPKTKKTIGPITYIGHGIPLKSDEYPTELPKGQKSIVTYTGKDCRPDCCVGPTASELTCEHGCMC